jgi:hypothetical protein
MKNTAEPNSKGTKIIKSKWYEKKGRTGNLLSLMMTITMV